MCVCVCLAPDSGGSESLKLGVGTVCTGPYESFMIASNERAEACQIQSNPSPSNPIQPKPIQAHRPAWAPSTPSTHAACRRGHGPRCIALHNLSTLPSTWARHRPTPPPYTLHGMLAFCPPPTPASSPAPPVCPRPLPAAASSCKPPPARFSRGCH